MESLTSHLPKVDDKALEFEVVIKDGQFNLEGRYYLQLSIQSLHTNDYTNIQIRNGSETLFVTNNEGKTDVVQQTEETKLSHFKDNTFFFRLPQGFCKNDKNHDVYLLVEAYSWPKNGGSARKVGEGKFAIYPRPNAPRIKANVNRGDNFYNYTDVLSLLRTTSTDSVQMHCGRIRCTYSLREVVPPKPPKRTPTPTSPMERLNIPSPSPRRSYETPRHDLDKVTPSPRNQTQRSSSPDGQLPHSTRRHVKSPTTSWGDLDNLSMQIPAAPSPPLPPALEGKKMPESPLAESDRKSHFIGNNFRHVARNGKEQVDVIFHGAVSLPTTPSGGAPAPYGVIKSKSADDKNQSIGSATHATSRPTHAPSWEELVFVSMTDPEQAGSEEHPKRILVISVADGPTKQRLVKYEIPMAYLEPFHQYHLELVKPVQGIKSGVRTFVTITRKLEKLPKDPASPNFLGLELPQNTFECDHIEAMLTAVKKPFSTPIGPLIAVARLVPDYYNYKSDSLLSHPRTAGVNMTSVTFPEPHPSSFIVPPRTKHGYPQISLPGRPESQPVWNHPYLFCDERDKATLFTPGAALVIEYYIASAAMSEQFWKIRSPIGFSSLLLDKEMYSKLTKPEARQGLRVEGLPIQFLDTLYEIFRDAPVGTEVVDVEGNQPRIGVVLRLITSPEPDTLVIASNIENLPVIDMFPDADTYYRTEGSPDILKVEPNSKEPTMETEDTKLTDRLIPTPPGGGYYLQKKKKRPLSPKVWYKVHETSDGKPIKDGEMPPYEAMETVLPDYQYVFVDPQGKTHQDRRAPPPEPSRPQAPASTTMPGAYSKYAAPAAKPVKYTEDLDKTSVSVLDHQSKELENYRSAVQKMGQDMVALQERIRELENSNSQLRRDLAHYNDASKLMIESSELDGLSKPEVMSRYAALKQTLQTQTGDLKTYKDKVQRLQNELIKKNDDEKNYLANTQKAGSMARNMQVLQEKLAKYKKMEETVKQQEQVIEKMERLLDKQYKERNKKDKDKTNADANEALSAENKRLRAQIQELQEQMKVGGSRSGDDSDKFEMYQALDKAEARIAALERQLQDNSRSWGKERADMSIRLNEAEHGFGRGSGMVLHDYPSYHDTRRNYGPSRYSPKRLSPLYR